MTAISTRAISRSTCAPEPPLVQPDNQSLLLSARSPDSIQRYAPPARSGSSAPPPPSAAGAPFPSPPTSRYSGACAISPPRAPGAPRSASALPSNIASPTTPRSRVVSLAIAACARTSSIPGATPPFSTSKCSTLAEPRDYAGFKPFGALACFVRTLVADDSTFDRFMYKGEHAALTEGQRRGLKLFRGRGQCASCHLIGDKDAPLTDGQFHALHLEAGLRRHLPALVPLVKATPREQLGELIASRPDIAALGRFLVTLDPSDIGRFRTPSLRNVALTAPYMHDGSVPTLARAVEREIYYRSAEVARPVSLTPSERDDLVAFLESLTSTKYAARHGSPTGGNPNPPP